MFEGIVPKHFFTHMLRSAYWSSNLESAICQFQRMTCEITAQSTWRWCTTYGLSDQSSIDDAEIFSDIRAKAMKCFWIVFARTTHAHDNHMFAFMATVEESDPRMRGKHEVFLAQKAPRTINSIIVAKAQGQVKECPWYHEPSLYHSWLLWLQNSYCCEGNFIYYLHSRFWIWCPEIGSRCQVKQETGIQFLRMRRHQMALNANRLPQLLGFPICKGKEFTTITNK